MQILPFSSGAHAAADIGSMTILQFEAPGLGIVRLGGVGGGVCLGNPAELAAHARAFEQLRAFELIYLPALACSLVAAQRRYRYE